jgi:septal ring factor EnvC (AmiA/AmiB activator)
LTVKRLAKLPLLFAFALFCLLLLLPGTASAEKSYQITEAELARLEEISVKQKTAISQLKDTLAALKLTETQAKAQLLEALEHLRKTREELTLLKEDLKKSQDSLAKANLSLTAYGKEMKQRTQRLKLQRGLWFAGCVAALVLAWAG